MYVCRASNYLFMYVRTYVCISNSTCVQSGATEKVFLVRGHSPTRSFCQPMICIHMKQFQYFSRISPDFLFLDQDPELNHLVLMKPFFDLVLMVLRMLPKWIRLCHDDIEETLGEDQPHNLFKKMFWHICIRYIGIHSDMSLESSRKFQNVSECSGLFILMHVLQLTL